MSDQKVWKRREFVELLSKGTGMLMGMSLFNIPGFNKVFAQAVTEVPVLWLQAGACSGCSVSLLNIKSPTIQDILLGEVVPGKHVSLLWHPNISAAQGDQVLDILEKLKNGDEGSFILAMEGAISTKDGGIYCEFCEKDGKGITVLQHLLDLAPKAMAILSVGTCASFGGIPAAGSNPTGCKPVYEVLKEYNIATPVVNIPGCPPHPDWFVGTVATVLIAGLGAVDVDEHLRPKAFYGKLIHDNCPRRGQFDRGNFAQDFGDDGCLYKLGCKGPVTHSDCPKRQWNSGVNWPIGSGHPCIGCVEPFFPYKEDMYAQVDVMFATAPATYPGIVNEKVSTVDPVVTGVVGAAAGAAVGAGIMAARKKKSAQETKEKEDES